MFNTSHDLSCQRRFEVIWTLFGGVTFLRSKHALLKGKSLTQFDAIYQLTF
jgi:hypothetical protein